MKFATRFLIGWVFACSAVAAEEPWKLHGTMEFRSIFYPKKPNHRDTHLQAFSFLSLSAQKRWQSYGKILISAEAEIDSHHDVARTRLLDWNERNPRSAILRAREVYWENRFGALDLRIGRQEIRWGRADGLNPTDNLAPYDFLSPFLERRLPVTAVKGDLYFGASHLEIAWIPFFSPSRIPLFGQRWFPRLFWQTGITGMTVPIALVNGRSHYPAYRIANSQFGVRWNYTPPGGEFSLSYYDGLNDLPFFYCSPCTSLANNALVIPIDREYHRQRILGADFSTSAGRWGLRGESAIVISADSRDDNYFSYILGVDKQYGSWFTILEFAGQWIAHHGSAPQAYSFDRGLGRAILLRTQYEMRTDESIEAVGILRLPGGDSAWRLTYSRKLSHRWQWEMRGGIFTGDRHAFLGQFRDSGNLAMKFTYRW